MPDPFATPGDVAAVWRPLSDAEEAVAMRLLAYASTLIRVRVPGVDDRVEAGDLDPTLPEMVAVDMVLRAMRRPAGVKSVTDTVGPYTHSESYADAVSSGLLSLSGDELGLLTAPDDIPAAPVGSFKLDPGLVWDRRPTSATLPTP
jgi:hypothetical protein